MPSPPAPLPFAIIVEDDTVTRILMLRLLRHAGLRPIAFVNAEDAITWLERQEAPALITVDLDLPAMGGETLCHIVRRMHHLKDVPIVIVSSRVTRRDVGELGATTSLRKPVDGDTFLAVLQRLLSAHHPRPAV
jgi:chemosensory pili system protein ChpA (sensor histidine kinase/response regulator)